jgi:hypothetical protein
MSVSACSFTRFCAALPRPFAKSCGYCTQTDKTGKRKPAFLTVEHNGQHDLCLMFPGFGYTWQQLDGALAADIQAFLAFVDTTLTGNGSQK